jgi:hypothetical protein
MCNIHSTFLSQGDPSRALDRDTLGLEARDDVGSRAMPRITPDTSIILEQLETVPHPDSVPTTPEEVLVNG